MPLTVAGPHPPGSAAMTVPTGTAGGGVAGFGGGGLAWAADEAAAVVATAAVPATATVRRVVRRATPATLTGVSGAPTMA